MLKNPSAVPSLSKCKLPRLAVGPWQVYEEKEGAKQLCLYQRYRELRTEPKHSMVSTHHHTHPWARSRLAVVSCYQQPAWFSKHPICQETPFSQVLPPNTHTRAAGEAILQRGPSATKKKLESKSWLLTKLHTSSGNTKQQHKTSYLECYLTVISSWIQTCSWKYQSFQSISKILQGT